MYDTIKSINLIIAFHYGENRVNAPKPAKSNEQDLVAKAKREEEDALKRRNEEEERLHETFVEGMIDAGDPSSLGDDYPDPHGFGFMTALDELNSIGDDGSPSEDHEANPSNSSVRARG